MFNNIITVCTGNICRSPAAEYILRQRLASLAGWQGAVHSAGVGALVNYPADEDMKGVMQIHGLDLDAHRAKQLTLSHLRQADLVLVMENHHRRSVLDIDPTARGKTFLLGHWTKTEIPDPYRRGRQAQLEAVHLIEQAITPWLKRLNAGE